MENPSLTNDIGAPTVTSEQPSAGQSAETESSDSSITSVNDIDSRLIHFLRRKKKDLLKSLLCCIAISISLIYFTLTLKLTIRLNSTFG